MKSTVGKLLQDFAARGPATAALCALLEGRDSPHACAAELIEACHSLVALIERQLWAGEVPLRESAVAAELLGLYQAAFRHMETLIASQGNDHRHKFVVVIPVADRPQHLKSCLDSLRHLCRAYGYGGVAAGRYRKVAVVIADDTRDADNIARHREIAAHYREQGLDIDYFGLAEQVAVVEGLSVEERSALAGVLGNAERDAFYHKGPSIMRNIAYLKLNAMGRGAEKTLFYFIDSDQEFLVKVSTAAGDQNLYALNYFHYLDRVFSETAATILTGKVVGDPPVSPAVMAGNFIEDLIAFLHQLGTSAPDRPCQFHGAQAAGGGEASYHDLAVLFGFSGGQEAYRYRCTLPGAHDHAACFGHFAGKLSRFFYGEHPTRKTYYQHEDLMAGVKPARTVYTGNYIFRPEALKYFIPFATLKLRMAGPVLGRIVKAELAERFVSANLPMLHKRTVQTTGAAEFRPGVVADSAGIDLSGEFERQFYGDVMLFTIEKLTALGYPGLTPSRKVIEAALEATQQALQRQYAEKRRQILERLALLRTLVEAPGGWWNRAPEHAAAVGRFQDFMDNIAANFGDAVHAAIHSETNRAKRHAEIVAAIAGYAGERAAWERALAHGAVQPR